MHTHVYGQWNLTYARVLHMIQVGELVQLECVCKITQTACNAQSLWESLLTRLPKRSYKRVFTHTTVSAKEAFKEIVSHLRRSHGKRRRARVPNFNHPFPLNLPYMPYMHSYPPLYQHYQPIPFHRPNPFPVHKHAHPSYRVPSLPHPRDPSLFSYPNMRLL